ncbi:MAG: response regulator [Proteobacteria bacterium]|nr:response regulator [Pseudomonadota bacterium]MDE3207611.1 response regulator [Pseudomonadota bacterium]
MRILLVEDDSMIGESVRLGLRQDGFSVDWVQDGRAAELAMETESYALVLLDLGLPKKSGLDLLSAWRRQDNHVPIIILTAHDAVSERVQGLDGGADDYLGKPFDLDELAARIRALLRRQAGRVESEIRVGDLVFNPVTREVTYKGALVVLSAREIGVLEVLLERPGAVLSREQLESRVYGWGEEVGSNAVEVHIHNLRRKLGQKLIRNVRGVGYMLSQS